MISLNGGYRPEFHDKVKNFCDENEMTIDYVNDIGNCYMYSIGMDSSKADKFLKYIETLETERKKYRRNKSFWWRLWN